MTSHINHLQVAGVIVKEPRLSHESHGEEIFTFPLDCCRLSGSSDILNVQCPAKLLEQSVGEGDMVLISGELRSFNNRNGEGSRLVISVFARELERYSGEHINRITLRGAVCKPPVYRRTPLGREICDIMLAVNRKYGKSDYLPCIAWGANARIAAEHTVGGELSFNGRVQSRDYIKLVDSEETARRAFEVSIIELTAIEPGQEPQR